MTPTWLIIVASSRTVTRPSCWQCDNPTWSHTALLSRFHARCRSSFRIHNWHSRLLGGNPVETLYSHCIHTQFHWSSDPPVCFPTWGTWVQSPGGYLCETGILLLVLSHYIGDPNVIDHCGLIWGGSHPEPSPSHRADNVIIPFDLTQLFFPGFMLAAGPPAGFTTDIVGCWGGALWRDCNLTAFIHSSTGPVVHPFASCHDRPGFNPQGGYLCETGILLLVLSRYILIYNYVHNIFTSTVLRSKIFWPTAVLGVTRGRICR